ncbi:uncharacterized protein PSFLO_05731 [Pseudozyma flocculosa]|nr:uncharacterized protein PSFLO_05731 [Pseudozyma flocculosa]
MPFEASRSSLPGPSTASISTTSSTSAALQIEDPTAAVLAVETNITAVGESVRSPTRAAEHELETQKAAAERGDHKHSMIGRTVEALGLASSHHRHHASQESISGYKAASASGGSGNGGSTSGLDARRRSMQPLSGQPAPEQAPATRNIPHTSDPSAGTSPLGSRYPSSLSLDTLAESGRANSGEASEAPSGDPEDRSLRPLLRLSDADRSAIASLQLYHDGSRLCLLVVHREGRVCAWSLQDGNQVWSVDLAQTKWTPESISQQNRPGDVELHGSPSPSGPFDSLTPMFAQLSLSMSKVGSVGTSKSLRGTLSEGPAASSEGEPRLKDGTAMWLASETQMLSSCGRNLAALRDRCSGALILVDLQAGEVVACEALDGSSIEWTPLVRRPSPTSCVIEFVEAGDDGKCRLRRRVLALAATGEAAPAELANGPDSTSPNVPIDGQEIDGQLKPSSRILLTGDRLISLGRDSLATYKRDAARIAVEHQLTIEGIAGVIGYEPESEVLTCSTKAGFVRCQLGQQHEADRVTTTSDQASFEMAVPVREAPPCSSNRLLGCHHDPVGSLLVSELDMHTGTLTDVTSPATTPPTTSASPAGPAGRAAAQLTAVLPLSLERIVVAFRSGGIRSVSLTELAHAEALQEMTRTRNSIGNGKTIITLRQVTRPRSGTKMIVGGSAQGDVAFWDATTLELAATWTMSTAPIESLVSFGDDDNTLRLHGCLACVAADGSVSIVLLDGLRFLYTIPGREGRLRALAVRADELLLTYDDGKARVWDLRSQELRRSIGIDQAQSLLLDRKGWWTVRDVEPFSARNSGTAGVLSSLSCARGPDAATLVADFRRSIEVASRTLLGVQKQGSVYVATRKTRPGMPFDEAPASSTADKPDDDEAAPTVPMQGLAARKALGILRPLLALVLPIGMRQDWDADAAYLLGLVDRPEAYDEGQARLSAQQFHLGIGSPDSLAQPLVEDAAQLWTISSLLSTQRALVCTSILKVLSHVQELQTAALRMMDAVCDGVAETVGTTLLKDFSLPALTVYLLDSNLELREASRRLFAAALARLPQEQVESLCAAWQPLLPVNQPPVMAPTASTALSLLGHVAVTHYKTLSPLLLKQISQSITVLLDDGAQPVHQSIAIDLCSAGFSIWQHYLDATNVVRSLFALATDKDAASSASGSASSTATATSAKEIRTLARAATLQIASENTPLFMTTLSIDILNARSPAHCSATMKLVAFMVRKKPEVLYPNLPRLAEAVVKSLDPRNQRDVVLSSATLMISELVSTYPSISFHEKSQRLAVGTHEGAVILYDLKTATRLFVLEGHRMAVSGVDFSPDGRRLVTVSEREGLVCVWKVSVGILGFFTPGVAPKQGGSAEGRAFREYRVPAVSDDDGGGMLPRTRFEWTGERTLRATIGETTMNLSVD